MLLFRIVVSGYEVKRLCEKIMASANFSELRQNFVKGQLLPQGIYKTSLLDVFYQVPREYFLEDVQKSRAYLDQDISYTDITSSRGILSSLKLAKLLHLITPLPQQKILVLGFNYGYSLALAHAWGLKVFGVEENPLLLSASYANLVQYFEERYGTTHVDDILTLEQGVLTHGLGHYAFYDYILIEGGVRYIPPALYDQLKDTGVIVGISMQQPLGLFTANKQGHKVYFGFETASLLKGFE